MSEEANKTIDERVNEVLLRQFGHKAEGITDDAHLLNDLHIDSLDTVELVMELETEFGVQVSNEDEDGIFKNGDVTIGAIKKYFNERMASGN